MKQFVPNVWFVVWLGCLTGLGPLFAQTNELGYVGPGTALVADLAASAGKAVAVDVGASKEDGLTNYWPLAPQQLEPGLYQLTVKLRLLLPKGFPVSRLRPALQLGSTNGVLAEVPLNATLFDGTPGGYTTITREFSIIRPAEYLILGFDSHLAALPEGQPRPHVVHAQGMPSLDDEDASTRLPAADTSTKAFMTALDSEKARPVADFHDPAMLLDTVEIRRLNDAVVIEKVWPDKVHVYPGGESNPITVTVRNYRTQPVSATVRLTVRTGLDETSAPQETAITVPGSSTATCRFDWQSGAREYGHAAYVEIIVAGQVVHSASEYFSVSDPIWKTSLQGSGFLTWFGREREFPEHVAYSRHDYINVEEAFSWQPSSWTDLNPTNADWWSGQGNAHNSLRGLRLWMGLSHSNGIKLITYSWDTASGPVGYEWARKHPDLVGRGDGGMDHEDFDIEDLRLYDLTHQRSEFYRYQKGTWNSLFPKLWMFEVLKLGASEIIKSAQNFGWDGVRFDSPPGGRPIDAATVHADFETFGVQDLMKQLLPEYYGITTGKWDSIAVTHRNVRYLRHRFATEISPHFAVSNNAGGGLKLDADGQPVGWNTNLIAAYIQQGGQLMDEAIRNTGSWRSYRRQILPQVEMARRSGGYHEVFPPNNLDEFPAYAAIITFASGTHPYQDYGWSRPQPGAYTRFMTRYGEYCWDRDLAPITAETAGLSIDQKVALFWKPYIRSRRLANGVTQTVVQLITPVPSDEDAPNHTGYAPAWTKGLVVHKRGTTPPTVWRLSAEPDLQCEKLAARREGDGFTVTIPEHRLWTTLVWEEAGQ